MHTFSASEVMTLWRYTNLFINIIIISDVSLSLLRINHFAHLHLCTSLMGILVDWSSVSC